VWPVKRAPLEREDINHLRVPSSDFWLVPPVTVLINMSLPRQFQFISFLGEQIGILALKAECYCGFSSRRLEGIRERGLFAKF